MASSETGSSSNVIFTSKDDMDRDQLSELFHVLAERIRQGRITLSSGAREVEIDSPAGARVEIELEDKPTRDGRTTRELEIEVTWEVDSDGRPTEDGPSKGFRVS